VQTFGINETKRSGAAHAAKNCIPNFGRRSAPKTNIFAATKPNPLCAARQASTRACTFERVANEILQQCFGDQHGYQHGGGDGSDGG
jgi:hypothetical protein